jgi:hypothetical protein
VPIDLQMASDRGRFDVPLKIFKSVFLVKNKKPPGRWRKQSDSSTRPRASKGFLFFDPRIQVSAVTG